MDFPPDSSNNNENPPEDPLRSAKFKMNNDNILISLAQSHRTTRPSQVVYSQPLKSDKSEYYEEWLQKCVAWIAMGSGIKRMDFYSLEKITNFLVNEIKSIGRKAAYFSRVRGCETSNFVDVMNALESVNPSVYNAIFNEKKASKMKQLPKQIPLVGHNTLIKPVMLSQPSALYFECMVNATECISELNKDNEEETNAVYNSMSRNQYKSGKALKMPKIMDMDFHALYTNRGPYSLKADEIYQQIVASRPKFVHKHMPLLPPEFVVAESSGQNVDYSPRDLKTSEKLTKQNLLLQSDLPILHRVQIEPELRDLRSDKDQINTLNKTS
ncbi:hypothetical protein MACJ_001992 [Theileria orientalis]|uniref:Transcription initiation factor TFIID subunit 8 n=1 Tax=Theileria orientalis TaxID=68886 RepID=A0A976M5E0_THEOR|nr:hypothetical protein MACJ_001992 [Theileria orientalis]